MLSSFLRRTATSGFKSIKDQTQKRFITYLKGTEDIQRTTDPTLRGNIAKIEAADKRDGKETVVIRGGTMNYYDRNNRHVFLPEGHDDLVKASHEFQHANDYVNLDVLPTQQVLEERAFNAQQKTAKFLGVNDQLNGLSPKERAQSHSQVKAQAKAKTSSTLSSFASWVKEFNEKS